MRPLITDFLPGQACLRGPSKTMNENGKLTSIAKQVNFINFRLNSAQKIIIYKNWNTGYHFFSLLKSKMCYTNQEPITWPCKQFRKKDSVRNLLGVGNCKESLSPCSHEVFFPCVEFHLGCSGENMEVFLCFWNLQIEEEGMQSKHFKHWGAKCKGHSAVWSDSLWLWMWAQSVVMVSLHLHWFTWQEFLDGRWKWGDRW